MQWHLENTLSVVSNLTTSGKYAKRKLNSEKTVVIKITATLICLVKF